MNRIERHKTAIRTAAARCEGRMPYAWTVGYLLASAKIGTQDPERAISEMLDFKAAWEIVRRELDTERCGDIARQREKTDAILADVDSSKATPYDEEAASHGEES